VKRKLPMECKHCTHVELVRGNLEGLSFIPERGRKKLISSGVYGVTAMVCPECGRISDLALDTKALRKALKK
jgi:hypothetical protein